MKIISADDHLDLNTLPHDLWQVRLPSDLRDVGPRVVDGPNGRHWVCAGQSWGPAGGAKRIGALIRAGVAEPAVRPSTPQLRLEDMDRDGVSAHVIYGPLGGLPVADPLLKQSCIQAYNDWTAECNAVDPRRLCNLALIPNHDPGAAAEEVRRVAKLGHRGGVFDHFASTRPIHDPFWEPLWAAAEETGLPISVHLIGGAYSLHERPGTWEMPAYVSVAPLQLDEVLSAVCFSGMLEQHPRLKLVLGESGLGWLPYMLERMDEEFEAYRGVLKGRGVAMRPSQTFARQVFVTFEKDRMGVMLLPFIGAGNVMWASDYPHLDSTWPDSVAYLEKAMKSVSAEDRRKVLWDNAAMLYRIG